MIYITCLCGHGPLLHQLYKFHNAYDDVCVYNESELGDPGCKCQGYKQDNLKLVEDIAKERGLV